MTSQSHVTIIGAGPIGLEMAVRLKQTGIDYAQFDAKQIGYTVSWFAPQTRFFSSNDRIAIAGVPLQTWDQGKCTREEYLAYLRGIVQQFKLQVRTYEPVIYIRRQRDGFVLTTNSRAGEQTHRTAKLILATGGTDQPRRLGIPGEDLPHVSAYFQDPHQYFDRELLIVGGRNSAVEAALRCHRAGAKVALSYRRPRLDPTSIKYWLLPEIEGLVASKQLAGYFNTRPIEITPSHVKLQSPDGKMFDVPTDFVLLLIGYEADMRLCELAGIQLRGECRQPVYDERTMETNVPGLYIAGTAVGGTQEKYTVFIENCHVHVDRIVAALTGAPAPDGAVSFARPES